MKGFRLLCDPELPIVTKLIIVLVTIVLVLVALIIVVPSLGKRISG